MGHEDKCLQYDGNSKAILQWLPKFPKIFETSKFMARVGRILGLGLGDCHILEKYVRTNIGPTLKLRLTNL